jgi:hypothetical protein
MRLRPLALPAVLAAAAAVLTPVPAQAAVQCGLTVPTKIVVNDAISVGSVRLTDGCQDNAADHAYWDYVNSTGAFPMDFSAGHIDGTRSRQFVVEFDHDEVGRWVLTPRGAEEADGTPLTQNSAVTLVKYDSELRAPVTRTSTKLTWAATATQYSRRGNDGLGGYVARPGVTVGLFHQSSSGGAWSYVKSATTSRTGKVTISVSSPKSGNYRLVVAETPTVWAAYSTTVRGR